MSDAFGGPGWWFASDGKWYPPEKHPDADYRARHGGVDAPDVSSPHTPTNPPRESMDEAASQDTIDLRDAPSPSGANEAPPRRFTVASRQFADVSPRPLISHPRSPSVVHPNEPEQRSPRDPAVGRLRVEVASAARASVGKSHATPVRPAPVRVSSSTDLVPVSVPPVGLATFHDRVVAGVLFLAGVAMIVGTFLPWVDGTASETGWQRGDGIVMLIAGVLGASMAGPITVGVRHIAPKSIAIIAGLVGIATAGLAAMTSVLEGRSDGVDFGVGFFVVFGGAVAMTIAGIADAGEALE